MSTHKHKKLFDQISACRREYNYIIPESLGIIIDKLIRCRIVKLKIII